MKWSWVRLPVRSVRSLSTNNSRQVVDTHVPLSPSSIYVTPNLWNCPFHEIGKRIAQFVKWALCLPISRTGQYRCRFREMGIRKPAHFTKWANVVNEIYISVHAVAMHGSAVMQGRHLYEYPLNLGSGCTSMHSSTLEHTQLKVTVL